MNESDAKLTVREDPASEKEYPLGEGAVVLGREAFNDVVVFDPEVSRRHAQISFQEGRYIIEDLGSTNGTFVNGRRVNNPVPLHNGDVIEMGEAARIIFSSTADAFGKTVASPDEAPEIDKTMADPAAMGDWQSDLAAAEAPVEPVLAEVQPMAAPQVSPPVGGAPVSDAEESLAPSVEEKRDNRRYIIGCGCLFLLTVVGCAATVFLLDALASDFLYCGPAQPIIDLLTNPSCP
jgi:predicted component of type VI protein secretion system